MRRTNFIARTLCLASVLGVAATAQAQSGPANRNDWTWPAWETNGTIDASGRLVTTLARPNLWTSAGEYQNFAAARFAGVDPHPGIDIRGSVGDVAVFPQAGTVIGMQNLSHCESASTGDKCRIFVRTDDNLVYYVAHFSYGAAPDGTMVREYLTTFHGVASGMGPAPRVSKGQQAGVFRAYASPANWDHMHVTIFDPTRAYDSLDPLEYLERSPVSATGSRLDIVDDEPPTIDPIEFVAAPGGSVNPAGVCGIELKGRVDIAANMYDTFFTRRPVPNTFPGLSTDNPSIDIKGARYVLRSIAAAAPSQSGLWLESPIGCAAGLPIGTAPVQCGTWRMRFPSADRNANQIVPNNDTTFLAYLNGTAPVFQGGEFGPALWDPMRSVHDHTSANPTRFIHLLTNAVTENSVAGVDGFWDTSLGDGDGRYLVTVEAWDFEGNLAQRTVPVTVNNFGGAGTGTGAKYGQVFVKDSEADAGQIPSVLGGEPFWASPDIIVVPKDTPVTPDVQAASFPLVVDEEYDVYVRAHNLGCADVASVQASVYVATPGTTLTNVRAIGPAGSWNGTAVTVPGGGKNLIGPFRWKVAPADIDGQNQGHRCFLAAIHAPDDASPTNADPNTWDVPNMDNVAQRNIQTTALDFEIRNVAPSGQPSKLVIELEGWPEAGSFELLVEQKPELSAAGWTYPVEQGKFVLKVTGERLETPAWTMPGVSELATAIRFSLPNGARNRKVTVTHLLNGAKVGGMVFYLSGNVVPT
jgi:hypothetical protein